MKTRDTVILLVVVAVVALFIFFYERNLPSTGQMQQREGRVLVHFDREEVGGIVIEGPEHTVELERDESGDSWRLTRPVQVEADPAVVDGLLSDLEFMEADRRIEEATSAQRKDFGLLDPRLEVEVGQEGGALQFVLGDEAEAGGYYLAIDGDDTVYVVDSLSVENLMREPAGFREKRLLGRVGGAVQGARIIHADGSTVRLERRQGRWVLSRADGAHRRASQKAVSKLVRSLSTLKALAFLEDGVDEEQMARKGFSSTPPTVHFTLEDGDAGTLRFGGPCAEVDEQAAVKALLDPGGTLVCVGAAAKETILTPIEELELGSPVEVEPSQVQTIEMSEAGELTVRLERSEDEWSITGPGETRPAEASAVEDLLAALNESTTPAFSPLPADMSTVGLDPSSATEIVILDPTGEEVEHVWLGRGPDGRLTFRRQNEDRYGTLEPAEALTAHEPWAYRSLTVVQRDYFDATRLELAGPTSHELVKREGAWSFVEPADLEADAADARDTVETACALTAERFVAPASTEALAVHGLTDPQWTVKVAFEREGGDEDGDRPAEVTIHIGAPVDDGRAALVRGTDTVMVLSEQVVHRLTRPLADRGALAGAAEGAVRVTLAGAGGEATYELADGAVTPSSGPQGVFDEDAVEAFVEKLAVHRASRVVSYGPPPAGSGLASPVLTVTFEDEAGERAVVRFGSRLSPGDEQMFHARVSTVEATYGVEADLVEPLL